MYHPQCAALRDQQTRSQRHYFKLTTPVDFTEETNTDHSPVFPRLNQTVDVISAKAMFGDQDAEWFSSYYGMIRALNETAKTISGMFYDNPMNEYRDYQTVYRGFLGTIKVNK